VAEDADLLSTLPTAMHVSKQALDGGEANSNALF
jgi:hypothetical protein